MTICDTQIITFMKVKWQFQSDTGEHLHSLAIVFLFNFIFVVFWYYSIFVFVVAGGWGTTFICWRLDGSVLVGEFLTRATTTNTPQFDADISIFAKLLRSTLDLINSFNYNTLKVWSRAMKTNEAILGIRMSDGALVGWFLLRKVF